MRLVTFTFSFINSVAGLTAFVAFLYLRYYVAALLGFSTAMLSGVTAHITWLNYRNRLSLWYERAELNQFFHFGYWVFALSAPLAVYYFVAMLVLMEMKINYLVTAIWGCLSLQSGIVLMFCSNKFVKRYIDSGLIVSDA